MAEKPEFAMELAVKGMLPKTPPSADRSMTRLKVYAGAEHKHAAQKPEAWTVISKEVTTNVREQETVSSTAPAEESHSVARVRLYQGGTGSSHHQRPRHRRVLRPGHPEADRSSASGCHRHRWASSTSSAPSQAAAFPARPAPSVTASPVLCSRSTPRFRGHSEGRRLPDPRPQNEGAKEIRSQGSTSCASVQQEIICCSDCIKTGQKPRKIKVFRGFLIPERADMVCPDLT